MITLMMPTYKRNHLLKDKDHPAFNLSTNKIVSQIIVIWHNIGEKVPQEVIENIKNLNISDKVDFVYPTTNSLNNRFYPYEIIKNECIYSTDDDYITTHIAIEKCYDIWKENTNLMVGVVPRMVTPAQYHGNAATPTHNNIPYNVVLTGGAMFHKKFLSLYWEEKDNLKLMDKTFNGEDIMFNFVHNHHIPTPPMYVFDINVHAWKKYDEFNSKNSIAARGNHKQKRLKICKLMKEKYGDVLISTTKKHIL